MQPILTENMKAVKAAGVQVFIKRFARFFGLKLARNRHVRAFATMLFGSGPIATIPNEILKDALLVLASLIKTPELFIKASTMLISGLTPELAQDFWTDAMYELFQEFSDAVANERAAKGELSPEDYEKLADATLDKRKSTPAVLRLKEGMATKRFILDGAVPHKLTCGTVLLKVTTVQEYPKKKDDKDKWVEDRSAKPTTKKVYPAGMREISILEALEEGVDLDYRPECCGGVKHIADAAKKHEATTAMPMSLQGCLIQIRETAGTSDEKGFVTSLLEQSFSNADANAVFARANTAIDWRPKTTEIRHCLLMATSGGVVNVGAFTKFVDREVPPFKDAWVVQAGKSVATFLEDLILDREGGVAHEFADHVKTASDKIAADLHARNQVIKDRVVARRRRLSRI